MPTKYEKNSLGTALQQRGGLDFSCKGVVGRAGGHWRRSEPKDEKNAVKKVSSCRPSRRSWEREGICVTRERKRG